MDTYTLKEFIGWLSVKDYFTDIPFLLAPYLLFFLIFLCYGLYEGDMRDRIGFLVSFILSYSLAIIAFIAPDNVSSELIILYVIGIIMNLVLYIVFFISQRKDNQVPKKTNFNMTLRRVK